MFSVHLEDKIKE